MSSEAGTSARIGRLNLKVVLALSLFALGIGLATGLLFLKHRGHQEALRKFLDQEQLIADLEQVFSQIVATCTEENNGTVDVTKVKALVVGYRTQLETIEDLALQAEARDLVRDLEAWVAQRLAFESTTAAVASEGPLMARFETFTRAYHRQLNSSLETTLSQQNTLRFFILGLGLLPILLGGLFFAYVHFGIWGPLGRLQQQINQDAGLAVRTWLPRTIPALQVQFREVLEKLQTARQAEYIVNSLTEGLIIISPNGKIRSANKAIQAMLGYREEELVGRDFTDIYVKVQSLHVQGFFKKNESYKEEELFKTSAGKIIPVRFSSSFLFDAEMEVLGFVCIAKDITKEKKVEEELLKQADWFKITLASISDAVITTELDGKINFANQAALYLFGASSGGVVGQGVAEVVRLLDLKSRIHTPLDMAKLEDSLLGQSEFLLCQPNGEELVVELAQAKIRSKEGTLLGRVMVFHDLTAIHQSAQDLSEAKTRAESALRVKAQFLANMSHEIRTPMNGVIGMTDLLIESDLRADQRELAEVIRMSGESLLNLLNDILDLSKIEAGKLVLETIAFDLGVLVEESGAILKQRAREKKLTLETYLDREAPPILLGDPGRIRQILLNLISNAIKFTANGRVDLRVQLLKREGEHCTLQFSVVDTGIGMEEHQLTHLFEAFNQADASTTRKYGGTGLGLAICKELCEAMGGQITVKSRPMEGTEFRVVLPLVAQTGGSSEVFKLLQLRVLLAEDNEASRRTETSQLEHLGCRVDTVDGPLLISKLQRALEEGQPYQILLLDHGLKQLNLGTALTHLRSDASFAELKIVLLSSEAVPTLPEVLSQKTDCILAKPVRIQQLQVALMELFAEPQAEAPVVGPVRTGLRVLVAEDNPLGQKITGSLLEKAGYASDIAVNGEEVLMALGQRSYDLILMDCQMPVMDGLEATRRVRALAAPICNTPIIAMTANAFAEDREACLAAGMNDFLTKPVRKAQLYAVLEHYLNGPQGPAT